MDPFAGVGTTLVAARLIRRHGIGIDLNEQYITVARDRLNDLTNTKNVPSYYTHDELGRHTQSHHNHSGGKKCAYLLFAGDNRTILETIPPRSIDLVFTSPPYWDMLRMRPSRRNKKSGRFIKKNYSDTPNDFSNAPSCQEFFQRIEQTFAQVKKCIRPGGRVVINTGDYRRKGSFIPMHAHYIAIMMDLGFELKNCIIWDRRKEYNIGLFSYPHDFIVNNGMFEYILEFIPPADDTDDAHDTQSTDADHDTS